MRAIIEESAAESAPGTLGAKVGDLYASFMDEAAVEARGRQPLEADLADIRAVTDLAGLLSEMARLQLQGAVGGFLAPYVNTDAQDSSQYIVYLTQSGLGLPDESYYHQESFAAIREAYVAHIARMLLLAGWSADEPAAQAAADRIMALETAIADRHWNNVDTRDALKSYNRRALAEVPGFIDGFGIREWLTALSAPMEHIDEVVVRQPSYVESISALLAEQPLDAWRDWLAWSVVRNGASLLDAEIVRRQLRLLRHHPEWVPPAARALEAWRRPRGGLPGEAVGELYVGKHFPPEAKARDGRARGQPRGGLPGAPRGPGVDEPRHPRAGTREARSVHPQDRLPGQVARLRVAGDLSAATSSATSAGRRCSRPATSGPSSAGRSTAWSGS